MKKTFRLFVLLAVLAGGFAAPASAALTDPAQIQTEAYVNLVQADQSLDAGRLDEALTQYQAARGYYLQLAKDFPGWEPRVIQYRKTYCDNQIADVERRKSGGQPAELPELEPQPEEAPAQPIPVPAVAETSAPEETPIANHAAELDYLKSRVASLEADLAEFDGLQKAFDALTAENKQLRADFDAANRKLAEQESGTQSVLDGLRADLARKDEEIQALQRDVDAKKQLDQALNDVEAQVNDLRAQNDRLNQEIKNLDAELDDAEVRADQAELKAQQAEAKQKEIANSLQKAEKEAQKARDQNADAARASRESEKAKSDKPAKPAEKAPEAAKAGPAASPIAATVPPRPVPKGMVAADFVRQLLQEGENDVALATVQEARKTRPTDMNLVLIESISLIRLQQYREAAAMLVDLAKNNPRNAEIHATLGAAMMGAGFYDEARETLLMAIKLDKNLPECLYNLAQLYALVAPKDVKLARKYYKQALDLGITPDAQLDKILK